jgi:hypothetical protein
MQHACQGAAASAGVTVAGGADGAGAVKEEGSAAAPAQAGCCSSSGAGRTGTQAQQRCAVALCVSKVLQPQAGVGLEGRPGGVCAEAAGRRGVLMRAAV